MKTGIDIYSTKETLDAINAIGYNAHPIPLLTQFTVGSFRVMAFDVQHDAVSPVGYLIQDTDTKEKIVFISDSFYCKYKFTDISCFLLECNYVKETLEQNVADGVIDIALKNRLLKSHFSLEHLKEFLKANDLSKCTNIILIHLSDTNSDADRIRAEVQQATQINTVIADKGMNIQLGCSF